MAITPRHHTHDYSQASPFTTTAYDSNSNSHVPAGGIQDVWLTNGLYQPILGAVGSPVRPKEWVILDLLVASGDRHLELELRDEIGVNAGRASKITAHTAYNSSDEGVNGTHIHNTCEIWLLALDGVYLDEARASDAVNHLVLLPGNRASIALSCESAGIYYLQSASVPAADVVRAASPRDEERYGHIGSWASKSVQVRKLRAGRASESWGDVSLYYGYTISCLWAHVKAAV